MQTRSITSDAQLEIEVAERLVFSQRDQAGVVTEIASIETDGRGRGLLGGARSHVTGLSTALADAAANLAILDRAVTNLGSAGGLIYLADPPGDYPISDSWVIDGEEVTLFGVGVHLYTYQASSTGGCIQFLGNGNLGAVATPQRHRAQVLGSIKATGWADGPNENALGFCRYEHVYVGPDVEIVEAGHKGITTQYGCDYVTIDAQEIGGCGDQAIAVEAQGGPVKTIIRRSHIVSAGQEAILASGQHITIEDPIIDAAWTDGGVTTSGAILVNGTGGSSLSEARIRGATITQANVGKGIVISGAQDLAHVEDVLVADSDGVAVDFFNCVGSNFVDNVRAPNSPSGAIISGTTTALMRRALDQEVLASGEATMDRADVTGATVAHSSGQIRLSYLRARKTETITKVRVRTGTAGSGFTLVKAGVWEENEATGDLTLVASSASDTSKMAGSTTTYTFTLSASFAKQAGKRYAVAVLMVGTGASQMTGNSALAGGDGTEAGLAPRMTGSVTGLADLPASISAASIANSAAKTYAVLIP